MKQKTKSVKHNYCEKTIKSGLISKLTITAKFYNNNKTSILIEEFEKIVKEKYAHHVHMFPKNMTYYSRN